MSHIAFRCVSCTALLLAAGTAFAHPGHAAPGLADGLSHPLTGLDHLLAIVAVGWWSAASQVKRWWAVPLAFALCMFVGALYGIGREALPTQEWLIAASVIVLGALMLMRVRLPLAAMAALAGALALAHGYAHGGELPPGHAAAWLAGMFAMTLALHLAGAFAGHLANRRARWATPAAGTLALVAGGVLLAGVIGA